MASQRWLWFFVLFAFLLFASPALAGWTSWLPGVISQSTVIHVCIFVAALALFLMLKR